jgi:hypothetical protein
MSDAITPVTNHNPDISGVPVRPSVPVRPDLPQRPVRISQGEISVVPDAPTGPTRPGVMLVKANTPIPFITSTEDDGEEVVIPVKDTAVKKVSGKQFRITERDVKILAFLGRYRYATVGQLARAFGTSETALRNRLPRLAEQGLTSWAWVTQNKPKVWLPTAAGLELAGLNLKVPTIKWGQFRHNMGLVDLGIAFEGSGEAVVTEREIRSAAGRYEPSSRLKKALDMSRMQTNLGDVPTDGFSTGEESDRLRKSFIIQVPGRPLGHVPDMVLLRQPYETGESGHIAVELELTRKGLGEWRQILTAYRNSDKYDKVHYFAGSKEIARSLRGVIAGIRGEDDITVSVFEPVDLTGDPLSAGSRVVAENE